MAEIKYVLPLEARTKKNHQMIAGAGPRCLKCGKPAKQWIRQGTAHDEFVEAAKWYIRPRPPKPIECQVNVKCLFYMKTRRRVDLLNLLATISDLLVDCKVLADDKSQIVVGHDGSRVLYDKDNPRVEIYISKVAAEAEQIKMEGI